MHIKFFIVRHGVILSDIVEGFGGQLKVCRILKVRNVYFLPPSTPTAEIQRETC